MMNTLPIMNTLTMSSREIAELTGKKHFIVLRDIRDMLFQLYDLEENTDLYSLKIQGISIEYDKHTKLTSVIHLDKEYTLTLLTGYNVKARFRVIKRWQELEIQAAAEAVKFNEELTWEQRRQGSKKVRADFTNTLKEHGVAGFGFAQCTNGIYQPLFGGTAKQLKAKKSLTTKDSLRDAMSVEELAFTTVAEVVASQRMDANADSGNSPCYKTCKASGEAVGGLLIKKLN